MLKESAPNAGVFEVQHRPLGISTAWTHSELMASAEKAIVRKTGWPIGLVAQKPEMAPKLHNIRSASHH